MFGNKGEYSSIVPWSLSAPSNVLYSMQQEYCTLQTYVVQLKLIDAIYKLIAKIYPIVSESYQRQ